MASQNWWMSSGPATATPLLCVYYKLCYLHLIHPSFQYALTAMQNLMDLDYGWATLDDAFIFKVVQILSSPSSLINVCRPATAILKKLVEADPVSAPGPMTPSSSRSPPVAAPGSVYRYGFRVVFEQMRKEKALLETVVNRLGSPDTAMTQYRYVFVRIRSNTC